MPTPAPLQFKRKIAAPVESVFRAFTHSTYLREWFCDVAHFDLHVGGRVYFSWNHGYYSAGEVTALNAPKKVSFSWRGRGEPDSTEVTLALSGKNDTTTLTLTHAGLGTGKKWAPTRAEFEKGWEVALQNLQSVLETGEDRRITMRPLLGLTGLEPLTAETATLLNVPVHRGLRLHGVVPDLGAAQAGLQKDDVLVQVDGVKVATWPHLLNVVQKHLAGDTLPVVFYRGQQKLTLNLQLSPRPLPTIPNTAAELAKTMRHAYDQVDELLANTLSHVSEKQAAQRPAPDEWSAREVLGHLLLTERDTTAWLAELVSGAERHYDDYPNNNPERLTALLEAYPTVSALLAELKQHEVETVAFLQNLPPSFVANTSTYWRLAYNILPLTDHVYDHLKQIQTALTAAHGSS